MKRSIVLILSVFTHSLFAQIALPRLEGWRIHASFGANNDVLELGDKIYVASANALFTFDKITREIEVISKVNGLSDVAPKKLAYDETTKTLVVVYENANIDLISGSQITNIPEILNQSIIGEKLVNNVSIHNGKAYLSCSFGISVLDLEKKKLTDSYTNLDSLGRDLAIYDIAFFNGSIFFVARNGIYRASESSNNLSDFNSWHFIPGTASNFSNHIEVFRNRLYATIDSTIYNSTDGIMWNIKPGAVSRLAVDLKISNHQLVTVYVKDIQVEQEDGTLDSFDLKGDRSAVIASDHFLYMIGAEFGLMKVELPSLYIEYYGPHGPPSSRGVRMASSGSDLWVASGEVDGFLSNAGWLPKFSNDKFYRFNNSSWYGYQNISDPHFKGAKDFIDVAVHPDTHHAFFASFGSGVVEMNNENLVAFYDSSNSSLKGYNSGIPGFQPLYTSGLDFDLNGDLWVSNFGAVNPLSVMRNSNKQWTSFPFPTNIDNRIGFITCDEEGGKWIASTRGLGIVVFNENKSPNIKTLTEGKQNGDLPSNTVYCITRDQKGEMWVGTNKGLCIFSNAGNVFRDKADFDSRQLVIKTGLVYSNFLGGIAIYCIRVDAANRKWIGTSNGVWLVSPDGYTVIRNYTTSNSPLLSNIVYEVGFDNKTGEVFFGTEKGMVSYMGTATEGGDHFGDVLVYPNPVRPDYTGLIAIKGLANNAYVKITDIAGNLVYETRANGGMATWNGTNFTGKRAATGVYLVFAANNDGTETNVSKILFIH